jgi:nucleoside-diphosphate-sugar epimerase
MTAFVTGAAGFIGLAVTEALLARGERVIFRKRWPTICSGLVRILR